MGIRPGCHPSALTILAEIQDTAPRSPELNHYTTHVKEKQLSGTTVIKGQTYPPGQPSILVRVEKLVHRKPGELLVCTSTSVPEDQPRAEAKDIRIKRQQTDRMFRRNQSKRPMGMVNSPQIRWILTNT